MDQLEPPKQVTPEMCVVKNLTVERFGASFEQQLKQLDGVRLRWSVLLPFSGNANQCCVARVICLIESVRISTMIEQHPTNCYCIVDCWLVRETRVTEI